MLLAALVVVYCLLVVLFLRSVMRATPKRFIKTLFVGSLLCFIVVNMNLFLHTGEDQQSFSREDSIIPVLEDVLPPGNPVRKNPNESFSHNNSIQPVQPKRDIPEKVDNRTLFDKSRASDYKLLGNENLTAIKEYIAQVNHRQEIWNLDKFDLPSSDKTIVIIVQVHNRVEYLKYLIDSLAKSKDIHQTLLIFSHDLFVDEMNQLVRTVDFCPTMQIFYPVMMQLHPGEFPAESPLDCPRDIKRDEAVKRGCLNAEHPDKYGHYREAKYTQTKHHWFWKLSHVLDYLDVTKNFNGPVLLIEEDHYMVPDFVPVLRQMYRLKEQSCKDCSIFTLGTYDKVPQYHSTSSKGLFQRIFGLNNQDPPPLVDKVDIMNWISSKHNMGMSLNREVWEAIKKCSAKFCDFDDYNWDWSLQHVSMQCMPTKLRVMLSKSPRIFHIGECGVHHKGKNCNPGMKVKQLETLLNTNKAKLFPDNLTVAGNPRTPNRMPKPNGGWGDLRDHELCKSFTKPDWHR